MDSNTDLFSHSTDGSNRNRVDYDESSYPASAESEYDRDREETDLLQPEGLADEVLKSRAHREEGESVIPSLSDDISCVVCAEILVEPCTLHCGHSFCQLCLAALWKSCQSKSPLNLLCPVCRQPWVNFPGVNIQLRNIIEKNNKTLVDWRRTHFSESDAATLDLFKRAKEGEWQKERQQTRPQQRPVIWIMVFIAILFCGLVAIIAILFSMVYSGSNTDLVQKPVIQWSNADVMEWLEGLGEWATHHNISQVFLKERINGAQLKLLNQSTLKSLGVHVDYFKSQSLLLAIEQLNQKDYVYPRNFYEFMAAHRKKTVLIGIMYKFWPRFTFFYIYFFEYHDIFLPVWYYSAAHQIEENTLSMVDPNGQQVLVFTLQILLVPHYIVGLFSWHWFNFHPWICTAIIIHCVWATQSEAKRIIAYVFSMTLLNWKHNLSQSVRVFLKATMKFFLTLSGTVMMWPIVPFFVCDGLLYLVLWNTVYAHLLVVPWKLLTARRQRINPQHNNV